MKKTLILVLLLMIHSPSIAMQCTFQKIKNPIILPHTKALSSHHEKKSQDFPFDPNQVLTMSGSDFGNTDKIPFCNYKHVISYPKECERRTYNHIKIAVIDSGINFQLSYENRVGRCQQIISSLTAPYGFPDLYIHHKDEHILDILNRQETIHEILNQAYADLDESKEMNQNGSLNYLEPFMDDLTRKLSRIPGGRVLEEHINPLTMFKSNFNLMENIENLYFTKESRIRFYEFLEILPEEGKKSYHSLYDMHNKYGNHTIKVCDVIESIAPGTQLDMFALNHGMPFFINENIGEKVMRAINYEPHFINITMALNDGLLLDHPFDQGTLIPAETIGAFLEAKAKGIGIILAAGNENMDVMRLYPNMPELLEKMSGHLMISCGTAYNWMQGTSYGKYELVENRASFSNYFYDPKGINYGISTLAEGLFCSQYPSEPLSGTSYSAPMVAAAAAILKSTYPTLSAVEIFNILKESSRKQPLFEEYTRFPHIPGVLNITAALELAKTKVTKKNRS